MKIFLIWLLLITGYAKANDSLLIILQSKAKIFIENNKSTEALKILDSCIIFNPKNSINYNLMAIAYLGLGSINDDKNNANAIHEIKKAISLDTTKAEYLANLGNCYVNINSYKNALIAFEKSFKKDTSNLIYNANYLRILWVMNKNKEAYTFSNKMILKFPNDGYAYYVRGQLKRDFLHKYLEGNKDIKLSDEIGWIQGVRFFY